MSENYQLYLAQMTPEQRLFVKDAIQDAALTDSLGGSWKECLLSKRTDKLVTLKVDKLLVGLANTAGERKNAAIKAFLDVIPLMNFKRTQLSQAMYAK